MSTLTNRFAGRCYICKQPVSPYQGRAIKQGSVWLVAHPGCRASDPSPDEPPVKHDFKRAAANDKDE